MYMSTLQLVLELGLLGIHLCVALLLVLGEQALGPAAVLMVLWKAERKCGDKLVMAPPREILKQGEGQQFWREVEKTCCL